MDKELLDAINRLSAAIESMNSATGIRRTGGRPPSGNSTQSAAGNIGQTAAGLGTFSKRLFESAAKDFDKSVAITTRRAKELADQLNEISSAAKDAADSLDKLKDAEKKEQEAKEAEANARKAEADARKSAKASVLDFGKSLLTGGSDLQGGLKGLGSSLGSASSSMSGLGRVVTGFGAALASGAGFTLGFMNSVAEASSKIAGAVDLRTLSSGFIATEKLFSGLGDSFTKVINESAGSFRFFGKNNEEAIANLGKLSRAFRTGLGISDIANSLGRDLEPALKQATDATNALGLSQDEQASLTASLMQTARVGATSERDAQRRLVEQYSETTKSARDLSSAFGISARDILQAVREFRSGDAGLAAELEGVGDEAAAALGALQGLGIQAPKEALELMATQLATPGGEAAAVGTAKEYNLNPAIVKRMSDLGDIFRQMRESGQEVNAETITRALRENAGRLKESGYDIRAEQVTGGEGAAMRLSEARFRRGLDNLERPTEAPGAPGGIAGRGTEADTQRQVNTVTALTDGLKGMFTGFAAGILATAGPLGLLAAASTLAAVSLGAMGGAGGVLGKLAGMLGGQGAASGIANAAGAASKTAGSITNAAGAASGAAGAASGAAGAAGGMASKLGQAIGNLGDGLGKAFAGLAGGVGEGLGKLISSVSQGLGQAIASLSQGLGQAIGNLGEGLGKAFAGLAGGVGEGLAKFLPLLGEGIAGFFKALANPAVLKGAIIGGAAIAAFVALVGLGIGAALAVIAGGLYLFNKSLETFNDIDGDNLTKVGSGLKDLGIGMLAFGAAMIANAAGGLVNAVAGFFGGDLISNIKGAIKDLTPSLPVLEKLGPAMKDFGTGLAAFTTSVGSLGRGKVSEFMNEFQNSLIGIRAGFFAQFGEGMLNLGNGMKAFGEAIAGIDADKMAKIMNLLQESAKNIDPAALQNLGQAMLTLPVNQQLVPQQTTERSSVSGTLSGFNPESDPRFQQYYQEELRKKIDPTNVQQQQEARDDAANRLRLERLSAGAPQTPTTATSQNLENISQETAAQLAQNNRTTIREPAGGENSMESDPFKKLVAGYLTTLVDDISAIRGNTRPEVESVTPVRMS